MNIEEDQANVDVSDGHEDKPGVAVDENGAVSVAAAKEPSSDNDGLSSDDRSPLEALMAGGPVLRTDEEIQEWRIEMNRKVQDRAQRCMVAEGWEYEVEPLLDVESFGSVPVIGTRTGYGYYESVELSLWLNDEQKVAEATADQPNHDYIQSLPEDQRGQWFDAQIGCINEAQAFHAEPRPTIDSSVEGFDLYEQLETLEERIVNDPRMTEAWITWSRCMAQEGFEFENRQSIFAWLDDQVGVFDQLVNTGATELPADLGDAFATLQDSEAAIKTADVACTGPVDETELIVRFDLEARFIDEFGLKQGR